MTDRNDDTMTQIPQRATLDVVGLGLAAGVTWSVGIFILAIAGALFDYGVPIITAMSSAYLGYGPSFVGAIVGAVWGFVDGFAGGAVIAWLYNTFVNRQAERPPSAESA